LISQITVAIDILHQAVVWRAKPRETNP